jgi:hypothetical protein
MKIGSVDLKVSILAITVLVVLTLVMLYTVYYTGMQSILIWGIPTLILLLIIPLALNYMSQKQYADLEPIYRAEAKNMRIRMINESMVGQTVRVEGVVERVYFQFLNRPQYTVADRSGEISVKMFTNPQEPVKKGDIVEVLGKVINRYIVTGDAVINCVSIRKIDKKIMAKKKE